MKYLTALAILMMIVGCGNRPEDFTYILPNPRVSTQPMGEEMPNVKIGNIRLADFLEQRGLVIEQGGNKIVITAHNRWGEPLDEGIRRYLNRSMSGATESFRMEADQSQLARWNYSINLEFDAFQARGFNEVYASGRWSLIQRKGDMLLHESYFEIAKPVTTSDYSGLITSFARVLDQLALNLASEISTHME